MFSIVERVMEEEEDGTKRMLKRCGVPYTRENYIAFHWIDGVDEWTWEHEMELPEDLRLMEGWIPND